MTAPDPDNSTQQEEGAEVVLLIDDCYDVYRLLRARLRSESIDLVGVTSGAEGLKAALEIKPSIILLDLDMPEMDGFEVLRHLKGNPETLGIPVIVLSGIQSPHDKVTAFDLGAVDYITKPFELTELRIRVRSALRLFSLMRLLAQKAQIDGLTGLWNRAHFEGRWEQEIERSRRHGKALSLAILDLDNFKSVNDTYGHPAGDSVIQGMAKTILRQARVSDTCCRYGGEEFVIIMPETSPEDAETLCERIRADLESTEWARHPKRKVTVSCGIAGIEAGGETTDKTAWLEASDKALYASKEGGRNRITVTDLGGTGVLR
ncbi:MAG: two-component system cell cycle response regulator [Phycisphaerales bacterium]|jgi:two-component system cell cycle response regulator